MKQWKWLTRTIPANQLDLVTKAVHVAGFLTNLVCSPIGEKTINKDFNPQWDFTPFSEKEGIDARASETNASKQFVKDMLWLLKEKDLCAPSSNEGTIPHEEEGEEAIASEEGEGEMDE